MSRPTKSFHRLLFVAAGALLILAAAAPATAQPARPNGYPVTNVNLRAGPGTYYPVITVVPTHAPISILGCLGDYMWCDVLFGGNRGWMRSIYLKKWYQGYYYGLGDYAPRLGIRVVAFDIGPYWDSNYRERPFYRDRGRWGGNYGEGWTNRATFYDRLTPYGNWIWLQGQYVWVPRNVGPQWRPYTVGRWVYTDRYGWMWSSREPFGWATYHYGRWGYSNRVGWFWVPGNRWAPAWVSWRQSDNYLAWAPLPPTPDEGLGLSIRVGVIPDYYWQAVPTRDFLDDDLPRHIVRDRGRFDPILRETRPLGNVTVVNNTTVVNNVININLVEQKTRKKVVVHKVAKTKDQKKSGKVEGAAVEIFQPATDEAPKVAAPPEVKPIEAVAAESETKQQQAEGAPTTEEALVPAEIKALSAPAPATGDATKGETTAGGEAATPPPPPAPPADGEPAAEEAAPPPPPPPPAQETPLPPPAEETPLPPPPAEETAPPAATEQKAPPPPPPAAEETPPPPPPAEETPPPPAEETPPPPPPAAVEETPPPPAAPPAEAPAAKPKKQKDQAPKKEKGQKAKPAETPSAPPPPPPPPQQEMAPPPPPPPVVEETAPPPATSEQAPKAKPDGKPKKERGQGQPGGPPASEQQPAGEAPPPPPTIDAPSKKKDGKQGSKPDGKQKGKDQPPAAEGCPEGTTQIEDGSCVPIQ
ncbi:MAG TPA: DUF6600 domain-containing protein [Methyloceanibacter sp.]|nr:DUF6600 domain-containing protein [Methyloceanibacter sp.]